MAARLVVAVEAADAALALRKLRASAGAAQTERDRFARVADVVLNDPPLCPLPWPVSNPK
jgi:hypothetical protein